MIVRPRRLVLLGHPVSHSLSPVFQNAALQSAGVPIRYEAVDVEAGDLRQTLRGLADEGAAGNVTSPHKEAAAAECDCLTTLAQRVGAVNTFWMDDSGALVGDNTDVAGFAHLAAGVLGDRPEGIRVTVLGAGGAAAAVLAAVAPWPDCHVVLAGRNSGRLRNLAQRFPIVQAACGDVVRSVRDAHVIVNATPVGQSDEALPAPVEALAPDAAVLDLVCRRGDTAWVRQARLAGHRASGGLPMLVEQGALAFERWLGIPAPRALMWRAACEAS
ncbi:MAG: shikimate dehydrogenase family protein [Gemmatimonadaceae bacterium]